MGEEVELRPDGFIPFENKHAIVLVVTDFVCPECTRIHSAPARLKGLIENDFLKTLAFIQKRFFELQPDLRRPTEEDYAAEDAAEKAEQERSMDAQLFAYKSADPRGDA